MPADFARRAVFPGRQTGFSLIEALIAVVVLSIGLLGMAGLQVNAMKNNQSSFQRTQAVMLTYFMLDAMRANRADVESGNYAMAKTCDIPAASGTLVANDKHFWLTALKDNVGDDAGTCGEISCNGTSCTVTVYWNDARGIGGSDTHSFGTSTQL